jgi:3-oxoacyl-[acyl-carrier protein] reductase
MKRALVLGGGGGIGAAACRELVADYDVTLTYASHEERATALAAELRDSGGRAHAVRCDATREGDVVDAFDAAQRDTDTGVDAVVFCVGGWAYPRLADLTLEHIEAELTLNLTSALLVLRECATRVADGGRVVLLSSAAADVAPARQAVYAAAKAGLEAAARVAAKELAPRGVTVNAVRPGATDTETLRAGTPEKAIEAMAASNAMRRLGTPEDVAGVVAMLVSDRAGWVTGAVVDATGGLV